MTALAFSSYRLGATRVMFGVTDMGRAQLDWAIGKPIDLNSNLPYRLYMLKRGPRLPTPRVWYRFNLELCNDRERSRDPESIEFF